MIALRRYMVHPQLKYHIYVCLMSQKEYSKTVKNKKAIKMASRMIRKLEHLLLKNSLSC